MIVHADRTAHEGHADASTFKARDSTKIKGVRQSHAKFISLSYLAACSLSDRLIFSAGVVWWSNFLGQVGRKRYED